MKLNKHREYQWFIIILLGELTLLGLHQGFEFHDKKKKEALALFRLEICEHNLIIHTNIPLWFTWTFLKFKFESYEWISSRIRPWWESAQIQTSILRPYMWPPPPHPPVTPSHDATGKCAKSAAEANLKEFQTSTEADDCPFSSNRESSFLTSILLLYRPLESIPISDSKASSSLCATVMRYWMFPIHSHKAVFHVAPHERIRSKESLFSWWLRTKRQRLWREASERRW